LPRGVLGLPLFLKRLCSRRSRLRSSTFIFAEEQNRRLPLPRHRSVKPISIGG
jgi:hypothetical protein